MIQNFLYQFKIYPFQNNPKWTAHYKYSSIDFQNIYSSFSKVNCHSFKNWSILQSQYWNDFDTFLGNVKLLKLMYVIGFINCD